MTASSRRNQAPPQPQPRIQMDHERRRHKKMRGRKYPMLDKYVLMHVLGKGTFGTVRIAYDVQTMKPYAVKIINKDKARKKILSKQVRQEVAIMRSLRHPNVVRLVSVFSTDTKIFIVMEFITGGELFREVERLGRMSEPYARFFFQQLVRGLDFCHSRGVFHRDLKPENLLLDTDKTLKITDFGLSTLLSMPGKVLREEKLLQTQCGTPHYVAPEILTMPPEGYLGAKTDVWSCGVILYVLVGGGLPFDDNDAMGTNDENLNVVFRKIIRCDIQYPPHFSDELVDLLEHIFKENPRDRYSLQDIARHAWFFGPIKTTERQDECSAGRPMNTDVIQKDVQEILAMYDEYKPTGSERNLFCNVEAVEHAIEITQGVDGIPLIRAPNIPGAPGRGASTDSLSLGLVKDSREAGLRYLDTGSWASGTSEFMPSRVDHASLRERDNAVQDKKFSSRYGRPNPEQITRLLSEAYNFRSHGSQSSDEDHASDLENALEIGRYTDDEASGQAYEHSIDVEKLEARRAIRRTQSANDLPSSSSWITDSTAKRKKKAYGAKDAGMAERFRIDLWNTVGAKFRQEREKPHFSANGTFELDQSSDNTECRKGLVRSASYGGPFMPQTFKPWAAPHMSKRLPWAASFKSRFRSGSPLARRSGRRSAVNAPSPLASTPVLFAGRPGERKSMASGDSGHEWKPYEHQDNLYWCKMMRDYDMIPDYEEFGMESNELNSAWKEGLARENMPVQSMPRSTLFKLARSSVELSSRAWREKSKKWRSIDATAVSSFDGKPGESFDSQMLTAGVGNCEDSDGDLLTHKDIPAGALRDFIERKRLDYCLRKMFADSGESSYEKEQLRLYLKTLVSRSGGNQSHDQPVLDLERSENEEHANLDEDVISPLPNSPLENMRTGELLSTPPGVAPGLIQTSSTQTLMSTFRYPDMPSRRSRDGDALPYSSSRRSSSSSLGVPTCKSPRRIATGPLQKGYGSDTGNSSGSNKSSGNGKEPAELDAQNLFHLEIPRPQIRPPLPESRPFSRVLKPTTRVAKRLLSPRIPSFPIRRPFFHSLVEVRRCQEIMLAILENYGCGIRQEKKKGDKLKLRVSLTNNTVNLTAIVEVFAIDSTLTAVTFERKSGDQSAFLEFFNRIRQLHSEFVVAESTSGNQTGVEGREKNTSRSTFSQRA